MAIIFRKLFLASVNNIQVNAWALNTATDGEYSMCSEVLMGSVLTDDALALSGCLRTLISKCQFIVPCQVKVANGCLD